MHKHIGLLLALGVTLVACQQPTPKASVVTTLFPYYSVTNQLLGDKVDVEFLLNPGVEAHDFSPTPSQVLALQAADLIIYTNADFDPWLDAHTAETPSLNKIAIADWIDLLDYEEEHEEENEEEHEHDHDEDPHFWIDPQLGLDMITVITNRLILVFPEHETVLNQRKQSLIQDEFIPIAEAYEAFAETNTYQEFIFAGHNAFRYLSNYNIEFISPFPNFTAATTLLPSDLLTFISHLERLGTSTIFAAETEDPLIQDLIAEYLRIKGISLLVKQLHVMENITSEQSQLGLTYQDLLLSNIEAFNE